MKIPFFAKISPVQNNVRQKFWPVLFLLFISFPLKVFSQTFNRSYTAISLSDPDLNAPGRGVEQWHNANEANVPVEGTNTQRLDVYFRFVWTKIEGPTLGSYDWTYFDALVNDAIQKRQKFSFGIMTVCPGASTENGLVAYDGGYSSYPLYLHNLMQAESIKDWRTGTTWTPNYNSQHYLNRLLALNQAVNAHIETTIYNGVRYKDVINCIDLRGYGAWGEWNSAYTINNVVSDYPAGTFPTIASFKKIVDAHTQGFPNFPLVAMIAAFDGQFLQNTWNPPEIAYYILTTRNTWGPIGWRRDQWGAQDAYLAEYLENNNRFFENSGPFKNYIMERWKTSPITGEPPGWNPNNFSDLEAQIRLYHATSFGNGNYGTSLTNTIKTRIRAASKACGYRLVVETATVTLAGKNVSILMNWKNLGQAPTYENWNVVFQLKNSNNVTVWSGTSQFTPKLFLPPTAPSTAATPITDNFTLPANTPAGIYNLNFIVKDPAGYRGPLPLAITGRNADSSYTITSLTLSADATAPTVTVVDNCGSSTLTAGSFTGSLLWSNGATTPAITVTNAGTYTVTQTVSGTTSPPGSGIAAPKSIPSTPVVTVVNNCASSVLSASGFTGSLLWSNGATGSSITVAIPGTYSVTQLVNGCTSPAGTGLAAPIAIPTAPTVTVTNNCESSQLTASNFTGSLLWSNGATTSSTTVTTAGTYTVRQTVSGCTSSTGSGIAAPKATPSAPTVSVANNCGNSVLTAGSFTGSLLWSTGATSSSITVNTGGTYTVTQTVNGCTSPAGSGLAAPINSVVPTPTVTVTNDCGSSLLTASNFTGSLLWSNGATGTSITVSTPGTYSVTQFINGCSSSPGSGIAAPIAFPSAPTVTVTNNCESSQLTASNFTGSLLWSNGATSSSTTVATAGTYTVRQTVNGCTSPTGSGIAAPKTSPSAPTVSVVNNCGNSVLTAASFTGSLLWSNGATSSSITVNTGGTYTVTQTVNGCTSQAGSGLANPINSVVATPTVTVVDDCGSSTLTASDFTGSLLWSNGATGTSITVSTPGTYSVTQSINGCSSSPGSAIAAPKAFPSAPTVTVTNNCESSQLTASVFTGSLLWSNGATTSSTTVTTAGTYTVRQTVNGCTGPTGSGIAAPKTSPSAPTVSVVNNCGNSVLTAGSFTGSLLWSNGATSSSITVNTGGTYTVTQTVNGCTSQAGSGLAEPINSAVATPTVSVTNDCGSSILTASDFTGSLLWSNGATGTSITVSTPGTYSVSQSINGCSSSPGSAIAAPKVFPSAPTVNVVNNCESSQLTASGFTGTLLWSNGATTSSTTVLTAGTYTVTQIVNGCSSTAGSGIAAPKTTPSAPTVSVVNNCGNSVLTASSFTGSLLWSNGATSSSITVNTGGTYTVTQTINGCTSTAGSGLAEPLNSAVPTPTVTVTNDCGSSILTASDFTGSLLWSNGATNTSITVSSSGTYTVTQIVDGCSSAAGIGNAAPKAFPSAPNVAVINNCESSQLTASGFTGTLLWSNGATTSSTTVLTGGTYTVTQIVNGCTSTAGSGIAVPKTTPSAPTVSVANNCGNSVLTAASFTGSLLWSNGATSTSITVNTGGTYTVTQTVNGCTSQAGSGLAEPINSAVATPTVTVTNECGSSVLTASDFTGSLLWSNGSTGTSITVSTPGTYSVSQSLNGCSSSPGNATAAPKAFPSAPTVTVINNCESSQLTASVFTGTLLWSNGATTSSTTVTTAGTYTVTQTVNGCTSSAGSGIAAPKITPSAPTVSVVNNCGNSVLTAGSFTGSLLWSNGATSSSITVNTGGTYTVTQTINGCTSLSGSGTAAPLISSVSTPQVTVADNCGSSILTATNFTGSLLWSNGATGTSITVSTPGTYSVTQSINGCSSSPGSAIAAPKTIPSAPTVTVINNCESSQLTASGFTGTLLWSNGATASPVTVTAPGTYTVTQAVNGCTSTSGSGIAAPKTTPSAPTVSVVNNCGNAILTAASFSGSLLWSNGATSTSITVTAGGTYTVTQTVNGCTSTAGSGIAAPKSTPAAPTISIVNNCGSSDLTAGSFTGSLLWSNGATTSLITVATPGTYTVTQTVNGCTSVAGSGIAAPKAIPALSSSLTGTATSGTAFAYTATSATSGTTFAWSRAAVTGISNAATNGTGNISETLVSTLSTAVNVTYAYTLTANGCSRTQNLVVTVNPVVTVNCVINGSIVSTFNSTAIPTGRYIWFNSSFKPGNLGNATTTVIFNVTNSRITFTANNQQYTLTVPNSRIQFDNTVTSALTQFVNNVWETKVPRNYNNYVFMGGLAYPVLANLPGGITNITWTADISINRANTSVTWRWGAAVYTSFATNAGLNIKPVNTKDQNPYANTNNAGTPENFKTSLVAGAKGTGGTNYTGTYSANSMANCVVNTAQRSSVQPVITQQIQVKQIPQVSIVIPMDEKLEASVMPNPSSSFFTLLIRSSNKNPVQVKVTNIVGQVVEKHEKMAVNTLLQMGNRWPAGTYLIEVTQSDQRKLMKIVKTN